MLAKRSPSGLITYDYEFHRPISLVSSVSEHNVLMILEQTEIGLIVLYALGEFYVLFGLIRVYLKEKSTKAALESQSETNIQNAGNDKDENGKKKKRKSYETRIAQILQYHPDYKGDSVKDEDVAGDDKDDQRENDRYLVKFFWDES